MMQERDKELKYKLNGAWTVPPLPHGSRQRFMRKLHEDSRPQSSRMKLWVGAIACAAAVLLGFVVVMWHPETGDNTHPSTLELTLAEVKGYYKAKLWSESEYIILLSQNMEEDTREALLHEVKNLDQGLDSLVDRLKQEPIADDMKIYYVTKVYKAHLSSMQRIRTLLDGKVAEKQ